MQRQSACAPRKRGAPINIACHSLIEPWRQFCKTATLETESADYSDTIKSFKGNVKFPNNPFCAQEPFLEAAKCISVSWNLAPYYPWYRAILLIVLCPTLLTGHGAYKDSLKCSYIKQPFGGSPVRWEKLIVLHEVLDVWALVQHAPKFKPS